MIMTDHKLFTFNVVFTSASPRRRARARTSGVVINDTGMKRRKKAMRFWVKSIKIMLIWFLVDFQKTRNYLFNSEIPCEKCYQKCREGVEIASDGEGFKTFQAPAGANITHIRSPLDG
jgi:hypothetical protein